MVKEEMGKTGADESDEIFFQLHEMILVLLSCDQKSNKNS